MRILILSLALLVHLAASAAPTGVVKVTTDRPLAQVYGKVYEALEAEKFWVVFEADMGKRMARFSEKWHMLFS